MISRKLLVVLLYWFGLQCAVSVAAQERQAEYRLGAGDGIRITVFQNPDLTLETRVSENRSITYPLIGSVTIGGLTMGEAEQVIARALQDKGFIKQPNVNIVLLQNRGNQVSVLGLVNKPGRYPLETFNIRLSEMLAIAGGIAANGSDVAVVTGAREGKPFRVEVNIAGIFLDNQRQNDFVLAAGDEIYVHRMPVFYVYGEVQRPGSYRVERAMTVRQALAQGGGLTIRGTERKLRLHRRVGDAVEVITPGLDDAVRESDVIFVNESIF